MSIKKNVTGAIAATAALVGMIGCNNEPQPTGKPSPAAIQSSFDEVNAVNAALQDTHSKAVYLAVFRLKGQPDHIETNDGEEPVNKSAVQIYPLMAGVEGARVTSSSVRLNRGKDPYLTVGSPRLIPIIDQKGKLLSSETAFHKSLDAFADLQAPDSPEARNDKIQIAIAGVQDIANTTLSDLQHRASLTPDQRSAEWKKEGEAMLRKQQQANATQRYKNNQR